MAQGGKRTGNVKWFNSHKGYGFITPDDGRQDLFVHQTSIHSYGFRSLAEGEAVEFSVEHEQGGRTKALDVTGPNGVFVQGVVVEEGAAAVVAMVDAAAAGVIVVEVMVEVVVVMVAAAVDMVEVVIVVVVVVVAEEAVEAAAEEAVIIAAILAILHATAPTAVVEDS